MIRRQGEYYICEGEELPHLNQQQEEAVDKEYSNVGDIKQRLTQIRERVKQLQLQKESNKSEQVKISNVYQQKGQELKDYLVNLSIPTELLEIEERLQRIEERLYQNESQRQLVDKKGTIIQRVKRLQQKLQEMIKNKSIEIINQNINQYSTNLDEKEQNFKQLYLYQIFNKTQGLTQEINILHNYLTNLSKVQASVNSLLPLNTLLAQHNDILKTKQHIQVRIGEMFCRMREQYKKLLDEIDGIQI